MANPEHILTWLDTLYRPGEIFEVRLKTPEDRGAKQIWLPYEKREQFAKSHAAIHESHSRSVWCSVCVRERVGSTTPTHGRVLWADFDASITSVEQAQSAIRESRLPDATLLVWSGNGVHAYWTLDKAYPVDELQPHARGVHDSLPADNTSDVSRVMRVPGTINPKNGEAHESYIACNNPANSYSLSDFPKRESSPLPEPSARPPRRELLGDDRATILCNWLDGHKHRMVLATAAYLRKDLGWSEKEALDEIVSIHEEAGYESNVGLERAVADTFAKPIAKVSSGGLFSEMGIVLKNKGYPTFRLVKPKPPKIEVINFAEDIEPQEFWIEGLVGPGLLTMWAAMPKVGKSMAAMQMGYALSQGLPFMDFGSDGQRHRVLYFQGELSKQMVGERAKALFGSARLDPRWYALTAKPAEAINLVENPESLTDLAENYDVIIVDPISVFTSSDESKSYAVNEIIGIFDRLRSMGKAVILVHHTRKLQTDRAGNEVTPSFNDIRGSGAWFASADALALHYRVGDSGNTEVKFQFRAAPDRDKLFLYRLPHGGFTCDKELYKRTLPNTLTAHLGDRSIN